MSSRMRYGDQLLSLERCLQHNNYLVTTLRRDITPGAIRKQCDETNVPRNRAVGRLTHCLIIVCTLEHQSLRQSGVDGGHGRQIR